MSLPKSVLDLPLIEIIWTDASINLSDESSLDDTTDFGGLIEMRTIGYLVRKTRTEVVLATDICTGDNDVRHSNTVPRGWVREIIVLSRPLPATPPGEPQ